MFFKLNNISKHYGSEAEGTLRKVLDELSLEIHEGETIAILGPSGTGKTTLLNIMGTLDRPDSGEVCFRNGKTAVGEVDSEEWITINQEKTTTQQLDTFRNEQIGFVFQLHHLLPQCTLLENILIPTLTIRDKAVKAERLVRAEELMKRVGIWDLRDQMPGHLSGGECQRAAVVRALINQPGLLLADEPTGALDEENVNKLATLLLEINRTYGVTLVVVTHSLALAAKMDRVYELHNGKLRLKNLKA